MVSPSTRRIGISFGNTDSLQDGLGEFVLQIGRRVAAAAPAWREQFGVEFDFHLRESHVGLLGAEVGYLTVSRWQRYRHVRPVRYDLWHTLHQLSKNLPPRDVGPRVVTVHDLNYLHHPRALSRRHHHRRTCALMQRTDHVVAISRYTADDVRRHLHWQGPLEVIYNGARDLSALPMEPLPGVDASRPFLFHLSRMSPSKNPRAILALAAAWPDMRFVLCGPPGDDAKAVRAHPHPSNVVFHLGISDAQKAWAFAQCAGFLFPSLAEGFGLPPIEAMYFGRPVFLARRTCLPEVGGDAAYYFDDFEPTYMRRVVEQGLVEGARPGRSGEVRAHAQGFDWDRAAADYLSLYRRLIGLPPA
jgi:glycosyltransferase involved in cell wall biosynthesis